MPRSSPRAADRRPLAQSARFIVLAGLAGAITAATSGCDQPDGLAADAGPLVGADVPPLPEPTETQCSGDEGGVPWRIMATCVDGPIIDIGASQVAAPRTRLVVRHVGTGAPPDAPGCLAEVDPGHERPILRSVEWVAPDGGLYGPIHWFKGLDGRERTWTVAIRSPVEPDWYVGQELEITSTRAGTGDTGSAFLMASDDAGRVVYVHTFVSLSDIAIVESDMLRILRGDAACTSGDPDGAGQDAPEVGYDLRVELDGDVIDLEHGRITASGDHRLIHGGMHTGGGVQSMNFGLVRAAEQ